MLRQLFSAMTILAAASPIALCSDATTDDKRDLQGEWRLVEREYMGKAAKNTDADFHEFNYIVKGDEMTAVFPIGGQRRKTFTIDTINSPKSMDIKSHDGVEKDRTAACIYKLEPDRLTICMPYFTDNPNQRPTEFKTKETDTVTVLYVFERIK